jgi:hypothetical protein
MSFAMTTRQMRDRTKTVTRRPGWDFLTPGDQVCAVEKSRGLMLGQKVKRIGVIRVISTRREPLDAITQEDVVREGFPDLNPEEFIAVYCSCNGGDGSQSVNRIEFEHATILV